jgi:hypothetical protein
MLNLCSSGRRSRYRWGLPLGSPERPGKLPAATSATDPLIRNYISSCSLSQRARTPAQKGKLRSVIVSALLAFEV